VNIVIAQAASTIPVPDVIGNTATDARFKLEQAGFQVISDAADSDEPVGTVIAQNPSAGTQVARDTTITITVSNGPSAGTGGSAVPAPPPSGDQGDQGGQGDDG
jgi:serine/threonine-protein kinase